MIGAALIMVSWVLTLFAVLAAHTYRDLVLTRDELLVWERDRLRQEEERGNSLFARCVELKEELRVAEARLNWTLVSTGEIMRGDLTTEEWLDAEREGKIL